MKRLAWAFRWIQAFALVTAAVFSAPAWSAVELRVDAKPRTEDIEAFVTVTDGAGAPVGELESGDFTATLDGNPLPTFTFSLPPNQDPSQFVSVIFAMDYSPSVRDTALPAMQAAVIEFINQMRVGDYVAILKFNDTNPNRASIVQPFTVVDGAGNSVLVDAVMATYPGAGTNLLDAIDVAVDTFLNSGPVLPPGPKALILLSDGGENSSVISQSDAVASATANNIPVFTIGVADIASDPAREALMASLAETTGGQYIPASDEQAIADAYVSIAQSLFNEYLLTIPANAVTDCNEHTLAVTVLGETASVTFVRCDSTPDFFDFNNATGVAPGTVVTSDAPTVTGIDIPVPIVVTGGEYSIGCGATFTTAAGTISAGQTVCVRHTSSASFSTAVTTSLIVGGVPSTFTSTTRAAPPPDDNPDPFDFSNVTGVEPGTVVTSNAATITGIDTPTAISVTGGEYSIGCNGTFTSAAGQFPVGQTVCVRHTASASFSTDVTTVLDVGGVTSSFTSTTRAAPPPPGGGGSGGGGGGGATGVLELLLGLGALFGARRRRG